MANWVRLKISNSAGTVGYVHVNLDEAFSIHRGTSEHLADGGSQISNGARSLQVDASVEEVFAMARRGSDAQGT